MSNQEDQDQKISSLEYQVEVLIKIVNVFAEEIRAVTNYGMAYDVEIDKLLSKLE